LDREIIPCRCKYLGEDNKCMIWETRPDICDKTRRPNVQIYRPDGCTDE
jgi:Fe-S-cluster containining protein